MSDETSAYKISGICALASPGDLKYKKKFKIEFNVFLDIN